MNASPTLLQMKYTRVVGTFAKLAEITLAEALHFFYNSQVYRLVRNGVSDMHCMSDMYLAEELFDEYNAVEKE